MRALPKACMQLGSNALPAVRPKTCSSTTPTCPVDDTTLSTPTSPEPASNSPAPPANELIGEFVSSLVQGTAQHVFTHFILQILPVDDVPQLKREMGALRLLWDENANLYYKLTQANQSVHRMVSILSPAEGTVFRRVLDRLKQASEWLSSIIEVWVTIEPDIKTLRGTVEIWKKIGLIMTITERALHGLALHEQLSQDTVHAFTRTISLCRAFFDKWQIWMRLQPDSSFGDCLDALAVSPEIRRNAISGIGSLLDELGLPSASLCDALDTAVTLAPLMARLCNAVAMLGDESPLDVRLKKLLGASHSTLTPLLRYAASAAPTCDLTASALAMLAPVDIGQASIQPAIGLFSNLISPNSASLSWGDFFNKWITSLPKDQLASYGLNLAGTLTAKFVSQPADALISSLAKAQKGPESWHDRCMRLVPMSAAIGARWIFGPTPQITLAIPTALIAETVSEQTSLIEILQWFAGQQVGSDPSAWRALQLVLISRIAWHTYKALQCDDMVEAEQQLRQLVRHLKDENIVTRYPCLVQIVDLLPLLPALRQAGREIPPLRFRTAGWLGWRLGMPPSAPVQAPACKRCVTVCRSPCNPG